MNPDEENYYESGVKYETGDQFSDNGGYETGLQIPSNDGYEIESQFSNNAVNFNNHPSLRPTTPIPQRPSTPIPQRPSTPLPQPPPSPLTKSFPAPLERNASVKGDYEELDPSRRSNTCRIVGVVFIAIGVLLLVTILVLVALQTNLQAGSSGQTTFTSNHKSCKEVRQTGKQKNGIYSVQPNKENSAFPAYCDMETDGGGWTLVASIHESDIKRKCYADDLWSTYIPDEQISYPGHTTWENEMTFGNVEKSTDDDYKNPAYYTSNASDVMIWHVQMGLTPDSIRQKATYRYRTTDHFLERYGGNLKALYTKHFPLSINEDKRTKILLDALSLKAPSIRKVIPNWYEYTFASDGVQDPNGLLYSAVSSKLTFDTPHHKEGHLRLEKQYSWSYSRTVVNTRKMQPFTFISLLSNEEKEASQYHLKVESYFVKYSGQDTRITNTITIGNYKIEYQAYQKYNPASPNACHFYFVVSSVVEWKSIHPTSLNRYFSDKNEQKILIVGYPSNVVFGYLLLATKTGYNVSTDQAYDVARIVLETVVSTKGIFTTRQQDVAVAPVVFDKGSASDILNMVPPKLQPSVQSGFLQFRAYNTLGFPNAFCPGAKMKTFSPEYVCIGGVSGDLALDGNCGDFAGWAGKSSDKILTNQASGYAHSQKDIFSTILIFYR